MSRVFPRKEQVKQINANALDNVIIPEDPGLTKREYFAAMAMQGLIVQNKIMGKANDKAEVAVKYADALIKELSE